MGISKKKISFILLYTTQQYMNISSHHGKEEWAMNFHYIIKDH